MKKILAFSILLITSISIYAQGPEWKLTSVKTWVDSKNAWSEPRSCNYNLYFGEKITLIRGDGDHIFTVHSKKETYEQEKYNVFTIEASSSLDGDCVLKFIFGKYDSGLIIRYKNKPSELFSIVNVR